MKNCLGWLIVIIVLLTVPGAIFTIRWWNSGDRSSMLSHAQLQSLRLSGTWKNRDGATITFSSHPSGSSGAQGGATFADVPHIFTFGSGTAPMSGTGHWQLGKMWDSPTGLVISFENSATKQNSPTSVLLLAEGDPASPTLICDSRKSNPACDFTKVS
ncbi:hypothetical protein ACIGXM_22875 [Kitasatospora sp. NPDC052896]|uniref:hypothetical protein n=1 Tax=Kitasatospora sp. NPDC052896 TaxID=3364061 RepID=UPI0037CCBB53